MVRKKKPTNKTKQLPKGHFLLTGEQGKLLKKGAVLKQQIKDIEAELEEVKNKLDLSIGTYRTPDNVIRLVIGSTKRYSEIDPHLVFKYMKKEGMLKHFWTCVKVQLTLLKKQVPETRITKWRKELDPSKRWSWK